MELREVFQVKAQPYEARKTLVLALNECGYGTKIVEIKNSSSVTSKYVVVVFEEDGRA